MIARISRILSVALVLTAAASAWADAPAVSQTFKFTPTGSATTVSVAGDFNNWSTTANPMTKGADGSFTVAVSMTPGVHHYKFVVDNNWTNDPAADATLDAADGQGGKNSGVNVTAAPAVPAGSVAYAFHFVPAAGTPATTGIFVAGDFNGWSTTASPMARAADGSYSASVAVTPGVHHYKYVIDGKWTPDPAADASLDADDGNGGKNSGFTAK